MTRRHFPVLLILLPVFIAVSLSAHTVNNTAQGLRKFDEYTDSRSNDAKARLDNFAIELQNTPGTTAYIIAYGGRQCPNTAQAHANLARSYLVHTRALDSGRVVAINGGRRSNANKYTVELWLVPQGASAPGPSPTLTKRCR